MEEASFHALSHSDFRARVPRVTSATIDDPSTSKRVENELRALLDSWTDAQIDSVREAIALVGLHGQLNRAHALVRDGGRVWARAVLDGSALVGQHHLERAAETKPVAVVCNHQSYIDSNAIDIILSTHGLSELAARFVSAAGPKVYEGLFRRVASASLNTIPVPQSATFEHTAKISRRELARQSLRAVAQAHECMQAGYILLIYPEGSRTRTGELQPFLPAVYRYFKQSGTVIVPAVLEGTASVMGVGASRIQPRPCTLRLGAGIDVDEVGGAKAALDVAFTRVRELQAS